MKSNLGASRTGHKVVIDSRTQSLKLVRDAETLFEAPVSTSRFGLGFENGSRKTPTGKFCIHQKIGDNMPAGTVFKGRRPVPNPADPSPELDLITSRILWLDGIEEQNARTKERYIYIHGTNHEDLIGQPASAGCIRMRNSDVIQLFDKVEVGTLVEILG
ncbi:MAG: L,D-transpeptidase [Verrucomicrobia bacterium]|jgi:L,D-transpeptidase YbiS|nr:L,D-transpeptidase [Verrucomicrobiota bacterium]